ncbi:MULTISPECIES: MarR family winged helix-turn-helix transcriptional regulator [unclassified Variovorax]|jgi:DNA-binding MarR family transcriptional regulator|uniref:MarR family winged helix-turn-helix transcriptional regulator n=1 Tax=Variovorax TaxID=34072 RepID=UPI0008E0A0E8|nr:MULTISPECIES: MarR family transcriptional regulator [unclassified Variovorax]KAF1066136.1 MAG: Multiple antibiotic resistance protein MarR [Variovorax sp.]QRF55901.1 MarR family transcriptional regulator [Variovorax paradoxus]TAJ67090.1 MAG: MarR family transcriptional regulator [Variovorax sp.]SFN94498.1 transcriptional regulator, MarR family [Variovorax sp. PDC80]
MNDATAPDDAPVAPDEVRRAPDFYRAESYSTEESIGYLMRRIVTTVAQSVETRMCEPGSPTYPQWVPLYKLHIGAATTVAELARACELDTGAMTRLLDRLEAKGLCRRVRSLEDRRVVNIELTDEGRAAAKEVPHVLSRVQNELLADFTADEWGQLKSYLRRILDNAQALAARGGKND